MRKIISFAALALLLATASLTASAQEMMHIYPRTIKSGPFKTGHIQGIAVDTEKGYVYYSYTTILVKTDLQGNIIGKHTGAMGYTLGQRKGLGLAMGEPVYVCGKDMQKATCVRAWSVIPWTV